MPRYVHAVLLAPALILAAPADAGPICQYVGTTGSLPGERVLANPCVGYAGDVQCFAWNPGFAAAGAALVICVPLV